MTVPPANSERRFVLPADYYSSPTPEAVLPSWASYGCGALGVLVLIIVFAGGAWLSRGGFADFMDFAIGMSVAEMKGMYAADVTDARKKALDGELERLRGNLRGEEIPVQSLQPFLDVLRKTTSDNKVTGVEAAAIEAAARKVNSAAKTR